MDIILPDEAQLWAQLERHVEHTRGSVGVEKILGGRAKDGRGRWTRTASNFLNNVAAVTSVQNHGDVEFHVGGERGLNVFLDISEVQVRHDEGRLSTLLWRPAAAVVLSEWAYLTWGKTWADTLDSLIEPRRVIHIDEGEFFPELRYTAQSPSGIGPYLSASSDAMARRGGQAEDVGDDGIVNAVTQLITRTETRR